MCDSSGEEGSVEEMDLTDDNRYFAQCPRDIHSEMDVLAMETQKTALNITASKTKAMEG